MKIRWKKRSIKAHAQARFVRDVSLFSGSRLYGALLGVVRSFLIARWLGPEAFGTWQFLNIYEQYSPYAGLGTRPAISRKIPFLRGKGDTEGIHAVLSTAFTINFFGPIIYSLIVLGCSFFVEQALDSRALAAFAPVILLLAWLRYAELLSIATGFYGFCSRLDMLHNTLITLFSVILVNFWGVYGIIAGFGISALIAVIYAARTLWHFFALKVDWRVLWDLIMTGIPITANGMFLSLMNMADKILIAALLDRKMLGIYGVGHAGISIMRTLPVAIGQMLFVKFAEMDGQNITREHMTRVLNKTTILLSCVLAPLVSALIVCFPVAVILLLPQFSEGISSGKLLIAEVFYMGISIPMTNWCISTGRFSPVLILRFIIVVIESIAIYLVIKNGPELEFIALCVLCASAIFSFSIITISNYLLENSLRHGIIHAGKSMSPSLSVIVIIMMQDYVYPIDAYVPDMTLIASCVLGLVITLVINIPFIYWANRHVRITELISKIF